MPELDGIEVLERIVVLGLDVPVIMISGHGNIETAVDALKKGAYDFLEKPLDLNRVLVTLRNALDKTSLQEETKTLRRKVNKQKFTDIIGSSEAISQVKEMIQTVGPTDARILITGENGTGKELVARHIHESSNRAKAPFVEVNCAAIPSELIESELFGHEKGSFTSAHKQRKGKFELAQNGTLFLDEIGDMSLSAQAKVLRALQENKITRVGGDKEIKVDIRIVAATNKDLKKMIEENKFREDLYHRLSVIIIDVPALRNRADDVPELTNYFLDQICADYGKAQKEIDKKAVSALQSLAWTGNIREFRNVMERLVILGGETISEQDVKKFVAC
ncbi:MAG TPA: sigma-54-dependent Fis family transcriptional regulator, partial [Bacteroidetes bacterium]|nr:sigma-54-dependent Fis family transcriptional regulator [Bacteroidota bacterium]